MVMMAAMVVTPIRMADLMDLTQALALTVMVVLTALMAPQMEAVVTAMVHQLVARVEVRAAMAMDLPVAAARAVAPAVAITVVAMAGTVMAMAAML